MVTSSRADRSSGLKKHLILLAIYFCYLIPPPVTGFYVFFLYASDWNNGYETCRRNGLSMVKIDSSEKKSAVLSYMGDNPKIQNFNVRRFWISLTFNSSSGKYQWADGAPLDYSDWQPQGPLQPLDNFPCVYMNVTSGYWTNGPCTKSKKVRVVCEEKEITDRPVLTKKKVFPNYKYFTKMNSTISSANGQLIRHYKRGWKGKVIYLGIKESVLEYCLLRCSDEDTCATVLYTENGEEVKKLSYCLLLTI